tara:strand:+ start:325 stop:1032 length:708 start_codon:yes stop_codon:yes gene_type:complete
MERVEKVMECYVEIIKDYANTLNLKDKDTTVHKYPKDLPYEVGKTFNALGKSYILQQCIVSRSGNSEILQVKGMDEFYSAKHRGLGISAGSDAVFERPHLDGPFGLIPYLNLYRVILTIHNGTGTVTSIKGLKYKMERGEFVLIDYNRDLHYIRKGEGDGERVVLKLHYVSYPKWIPLIVARIYGGINTLYNTVARNLFLYSLKPVSFPQKVVAVFINGTTVLFSKVRSVIKTRD